MPLPCEPNLKTDDHSDPQSDDDEEFVWEVVSDPMLTLVVLHR